MHSCPSNSSGELEPGNAVRRILVFRPGAIGDTLLSFPALLALRRQCTGAEITVVGNQAPLGLGRAAGILDCHDAFGAAWISDLFGDEPTPALRRRLEYFDLGIVWMHSADAAEDLACRLEAAGLRRLLPLVGFPPAGSRVHLADHLLETLAPLGVSGPRPEVRLRSATDCRNERRGSPHPSSPSEEERTQGLRAATPSLREKDDRLVVLHPGAGGRRKRWSSAGFAALADRFASLGHSTAITCGPADEDAVAAVQSELRVARPEVLAGRRLDELASILANATLFVGNDSGITHLAALLGVPTVAIFGPFDPVYWAPIGERVSIVDAGFACRHRDDPRDGCRQCDPLASLDLETVWEAVWGLGIRSEGSRVGNQG